MQFIARTSLAILFIALVTQSEAYTLRLTPGMGQIDLSGQIYDHRSFTVGITDNGFQDAVWGQVRTIQLRRKTYEDKDVESGFGYVSYLPTTRWWVGGGTYTLNSDGVFVTVVPWVQASYAATPAFWLQSAVFGGSRNENGFEGGLGQAECNFLYFVQHNQFKLGGFASAAKGQQPGGGGVAQYTLKTQWFDFTTMACIGDFSHWIERETLLKYETPIRTNAIGRGVATVYVTHQLFVEGAAEYNRCTSPFTQKLFRSKEVESWFGSFGLGYRSGW